MALKPTCHNAGEDDADDDNDFDGDDEDFLTMMRSLQSPDSQNLNTTETLQSYSYGQDDAASRLCSHTTSGA